MLFPHFRLYKRQDIQNITRLRRFETKLGECIQILPNGEPADMLHQSTAKYVLVGIPEDIGVLANYGTGGADTAWLPLLQALCNIQSTDFFSGEQLLILGHFDFSDVKALIGANAKNQDELVDACRHAVANIIDMEVEELIKMITGAGKTPIVIGGGHNNAYPIIKGAAKGLYKAGKTAGTQINSINADAHADYRVQEGRHSGNAFRYAMEDGFLKKYAIIGLHENYNSQSMLDELYSNINIQYSTYEDIFIREKLNFRQAVVQAMNFTEDKYTGIELDLDCVQQMPEQCRIAKWTNCVGRKAICSFLSHFSQVDYLHICEGAAQLANGQQDPSIGKLLGYLVIDFMKGNKP